MNTQAQHLHSTPDPDDVPNLLACSRDEGWPVRAQAANALGMVGEVSAVPRLKEMGSDDAWWVRRNACFALAGITMVVAALTDWNKEGGEHGERRHQLD